MSTISAKDVKRLRDITGVGMMDCKKALTEADGDFEAAVELLRKQGQKVAAKRSERDASEGVIATATTEDGSVGVIAEVNSETDFVARNDEFTTFADRITALILRERPADLGALHGLEVEGGRTVEQAVTDMTGKIGEKIEVRRFEIVEAAAGNQIVSYIHPGAKLGVLVEMQGGIGSSNGVADAGRDVAMQVAAMSPVAATRDEVPQDVQDKEREIGREQARTEGKPEQILDKIAEGKLNRYFKDNVLVEQPFVKDSSMTVGEMLEKGGTGVARYVRYGLGG